MAIYLDNNATTPIIVPVSRKLIHAIVNTYGNPSDLYTIGIIAKREIEDARLKIAELIGANLRFDKILFTGCATEANNAVFHSAMKLYPKKKHIIVSSVEHLSVLEVARDSEKYGYSVTYIPVDCNGSLDLDYLKQNLEKDTLLVSIMTANNETGVIFPIEEVVEIVRACSSEILIHTDAVQAIGKIPVDVKLSGVDFLTISGHKFHAPKGVGALYVKGGVEFSPFLLGGHQEKRLRAGTENTTSIIAMGEAAVHAQASINDQHKVGAMRDVLEQKLTTIPIESSIIGASSNRLSNTTNIAFANVDGVELMLKLSEHGIYVSTGSACNSEIAEPSHVIVAMAIQEKFQRPIRVSLSKINTREEINEFIATITPILTTKRR